MVCVSSSLLSVWFTADTYVTVCENESRFKFHNLYFNNHITMTLHIVEQHIHILLCITYLQSVFSFYKCKSGSKKFNKTALDQLFSIILSM